MYSSLTPKAPSNVLAIASLGTLALLANSTAALKAVTLGFCITSLLLLSSLTNLSIIPGLLPSSAASYLVWKSLKTVPIS